jgi:glycosyltransferase involved in cell wall biosynthesis
MRIALLSPNFPPDACGVGDYTSLLADQLITDGHDACVWTRQPRPVPSKALIRSIGMGNEGPWNLHAMAEITRDVAAWHPDCVTVQFSPNLYAHKLRGIAPHLPVWLAALRAATGAPIALMAHEQSYPAAFFPADRLLIGVPQLAIFQALCLVCDAVLFAIEVGASKYERRYPFLRGRFHWLPVGSNIPVSTAASDGFIQREGIAPGEIVLLLFGTPHPTRLFGHSFMALTRARNEGLPARLIAVGTSNERLRQEISDEKRPELTAHAIGLGYLRNEEASHYLKRADVVLAPFLDGVSSRRGSVMAALSHSRPVVTNLGWATDLSAGWNEFTQVASDNSPEGFAEAVVSLLRDDAMRERVAELGNKAYRAKFDWPVVSAHFSSILAALRRRRG